MSLNSEPLKENNDLLSLIDAGIAALRGEEPEPVELTPEQVIPKKGKETMI